MDMIQILEGARDQIKIGWCKHTSAKDKDGAHVLPTSEAAVSWCMIGAIQSQTIDHTMSYDKQTAIAQEAVDIIARYLPRDADFVSEYNDKYARTTLGPVRVFNKAIRALKAQKENNNG